MSICITSLWKLGGTHIKANGDVPLYWVTFLQEILKHGSHFLQKKIHNKTWVQFSIWAQIFEFSHGKNPENRKICEKWAYFSRKILNNGYLSAFLPKWILKMGRGFEAQVAHLCPNQIWVPPRVWKDSTSYRAKLTTYKLQPIAPFDALLIDRNCNLLQYS